jgi:hypothetical protein
VSRRALIATRITAARIGQIPSRQLGESSHMNSPWTYACMRALQSGVASRSIAGRRLAPCGRGRVRSFLAPLWRIGCAASNDSLAAGQQTDARTAYRPPARAHA